MENWKKWIKWYFILTFIFAGLYVLEDRLDLLDLLKSALHNVFTKEEIVLSKEESLLLEIEKALTDKKFDNAYSLLQRVNPEGNFSEMDEDDGYYGNRAWNKYATFYNSTLDEIISGYLDMRNLQKARAISNSYKGVAQNTGILLIADERYSSDNKYKYVLDFSHKESKIKELEVYTSSTPKTNSVQAATESENLETSIKLNKNYLGLYVFQSTDGNTRFYKFIENPADGIVTVLYQDNLSGTVKIENYSLKKFTETTGEAVLENSKNADGIIKVFFRKEPESSNGYKLMDSDGIQFTFVSY
jgi:hypothetical protein